MTEKKPQILIVEDEPVILSLLSDMLSIRGGFPVIMCQSGEEALKVYRNQFSEIALVILDMNMPGMGGPEVFQEMKKINPEVRALVSTGYGKGEKINTIIKEGVKGYIQKPYNIHELLKTVQDIIKSGNDNR